MVDLIAHDAPSMIGHVTIGNLAPKISSTIASSTKNSMRRYDHMREHDNYLDEEFKTVSARQAETFEVL